MSSKQIRIIPMSDKEFKDNNRYEIQKNYFLDELKNNGGKYYRKTGINSFEGSLFLFQYKNQIIASATFEKDVDESRGEYKGYYQFDFNSIIVLDPVITPDDLRRIDGKFDSLNQSKQSIDNRYLLQIRALIDKRNVAEVFSDEEVGPPRIKTCSKWCEVLEKERNEKDSFIPVLEYYFNCPNYEADQKDVEQACGIQGLNLRMGRFGERIINWTGIPRQRREEDNPLGKERFFNIPFTGKVSEGKYIWRLRPELVETLQSLGLKEHEAKSPVFPDELSDDSAEYIEGKKKSVLVNQYERDPKARSVCINHYGANCFICGFDFGEAYGKECEGLIHVHHLRKISETDGEHSIDPIEDLRPVCPNCHMVLHSKKEGYSIDEVIKMINTT